MVIGIGRITIFLPGSRSLKEKRSVVNSVKDRIQNEYNVSVSELEDHDQHGRCVIGLSCVSRNGEVIQKTFDQIGESLERRRDLVIASYEIEIGK